MHNLNGADRHGRRSTIELPPHELTAVIPYFLLCRQDRRVTLTRCSLFHSEESWADMIFTAVGINRVLTVALICRTNPKDQFSDILLINVYRNAFYYLKDSTTPRLKHLPLLSQDDRRCGSSGAPSATA